MPALTTDRRTVERSGSIRELGVRAGVTVYAGAMAAVDVDGWVVPAAAVLAHRVIGRAEARVAGGAVHGAERIRVVTGIYRYGNSAAGDLITRAAIGQPAYVVDDQTVALTSAANTRPVAGTIFDVDADGVWVRFG